MKFFLFLLFLFLGGISISQAQTISDLSTQKVAVGEQLVVSGSALPGTTQAEASISGMTAKVISGSGTELKLRIPSGLQYDFLQIRNNETGDQLYSTQKLLPTFNGGAFDVAKMGQKHYFPDLNGIYDIEIADFDGDGLPDMVSSHGNLAALKIYRNRTTNPTAPTFAESGLTTSFLGGDLSSTDLDGDGLPELVLGGFSTSVNFLYILPNQSSAGTIAFGDPKLINLTAPGMTKVRFFDLNGDAKPEIILSNKASGIITIFENSSSPGSLSFGITPKTFAVEAINTYGISINDMNQDGKIDICLIEYPQNKVVVMTNTSEGGSVSFESQVMTTDYGLSDIQTADFNDDGKPDIAVTNLVLNAVLVYPNTGGEGQTSFGNPIRFNVGTQPGSLQVGDFNGDGKADLSVGHELQNAVGILVNSTAVGGNPAFTYHSLGTADRSKKHRAADINADGKTDIVFTGASGSQIGIIRNTHCINPKLYPAGPLTLCTGTSKQLRATVVPGATYQWKRNGTLMADESEMDLLVTEGGSYSVIITSAEGCSQETNAITVNEVDAGTEASSFAPVGTVCEGNDFQLSVTPVSGATYVFSGPNGFQQNGSSPTVTVSQATLASAGIYQVQITTADCDWVIYSDPVEILPNPRPVIQSSSGNSFCEESEVVLSTEAGKESYLWFLNGTALTQEDAVTHQVRVRESGEYIVEIEQANGCKRLSTTFTLTEIAAPQASFSLPEVGCIDAPIQFTNSSDYASVQTPVYRWQFGDGAESSAENPAHTYTSAGQYTVSLTIGYQNLDCINTITKEVEISANPEVHLITSSLAFCQGDSVLLEPSLPVKAALWNDGNTQPARWVKTGGTFSAEFTLENGCTASASVTVEMETLPEITLQADKSTIIPGKSVTLRAEGALTYRWEEDKSLSSLQGQEVMASPTVTTTYTVYGTNGLGCEVAESITIEVDNEFVVQVPKIFIPAREQTWKVGQIEFYPNIELRILDELGKAVYAKKGYDNSWTGAFAGAQLPEGIYYYFFLDNGGKLLKSGSITLIR